MSDGWLRVTTEEDRERLHAARYDAGVCAACGRALGVVETVYLERFTVVRSSLSGPVGRECASHGVLARMRQVEPERCVWCERGVYDGAEHSNRRWATCSQRCRVRAGQSKRRKGVE
jgi:hypothetical protein